MSQLNSWFCRAFMMVSVAAAVYDSQTKVALVVDEWGARYAPLAGTNPGFLVQQNSLRDAVLAALNLNVFARHADDVRPVSGCHLRSDLVRRRRLSAWRRYLTARVDAIAAKDTGGKLWLVFTNLDPNQPVDAEVTLASVAQNRPLERL